MLYRLYTEDKNLSLIQSELARLFEAYTLITAQGVWQGVQEDTLIIEIITDEPQEAILRLAERIRLANDQQAVLVTAMPLATWFVAPVTSLISEGVLNKEP